MHTIRITSMMLFAALLAVYILPATVPAAAQNNPSMYLIPIEGNRLYSTLSPDGTLLAVYEFPMYTEDIDSVVQAVRVIDLASGDSTLFDGATGFTVAAAFTADNTTLVTYQGAGEIAIWDVASSTLERQIPALPLLLPFALTPDGAFLVQPDGSSAPILNVWDLQTGAITGFLFNRAPSYAEWYAQDGSMNDQVWSVIAAPDNRTVYSASLKGFIRRWDLATAEGLLLHAGNPESNGVNIRALHLIANGTQLAFYHRINGQIVILDAMSGMELFTFDATTTHDIATSTQGTRVAWLDATANQFALWDASAPDTIQPYAIEAPLPYWERGGFTTLHLSPDGQQLIFTGFQGDADRHNAIAVIDLSD